jgi:hypothetical protein
MTSFTKLEGVSNFGGTRDLKPSNLKSDYEHGSLALCSGISPFADNQIRASNLQKREIEHPILKRTTETIKSLQACKE